MCRHSFHLAYLLPIYGHARCCTFYACRSSRREKGVVSALRGVEGCLE